MEIPRQCQAVNLSVLLPVVGLGLTEASCCLFDRIEEVVKHEQRPFKWKSCLGWPISWVRWSLWKLQGRSNSVCQVDGILDVAPLSRLMES